MEPKPKNCSAIPSRMAVFVWAVITSRRFTRVSPWGHPFTFTEMTELEIPPQTEWTPPVPTWKDRTDEALRRLMQPVPALSLLAIGIALLSIGLGIERLMRRSVLQLQDVTAAARRAEDQSESAASHFHSLA